MLTAQSLAPRLSQAQAAPCRSAVLVPILNRPQGPALLMEVRSPTVAQPGEICLPGGHTEPGETAVQTALRETAEELGLPANGFTVAGLFPLVPYRPVQPVVAVADESILLRLRPDQAEVSETFLLPLRWLKQTPPQYFEYHRPGIPDPEMPPILSSYVSHYPNSTHTWYWQYHNYGIWGLTAFILRWLVDILPQDL